MGEDCGCCCCGHGHDVDCCESCGMPMETQELRGGSKKDNKNCKYCCDEKGDLLPRETVRKNLIEFMIEHQDLNQEDAEKEVDEFMKKMPAWK